MRDTLCMSSSVARCEAGDRDGKGDRDRQADRDRDSGGVDRCGGRAESQATTAAETAEMAGTSGVREADIRTVRLLQQWGVSSPSSHDPVWVWDSVICGRRTAFTAARDMDLGCSASAGAGAGASKSASASAGGGASAGANAGANASASVGLEGAVQAAMHLSGLHLSAASAAVSQGILQVG